MIEQGPDITATEVYPPANSHTETFTALGQAALPGSAVTPGEALPDLRILMADAAAGDEHATVHMHTLTQRIISARLRSYKDRGIDTGNIRGLVTEKLFNSGYDPHRPLPPNTPPEQAPKTLLVRYAKYVGAAVHTAALDNLRLLAKEQPIGDMYNADEMKPVTPGVPTHYDNGDVTHALPDDMVKKALSGQQRAVFELAREGIPYTDIARKIGSSYGAVKATMQRAIQNLEEQILTPAGLIRIEEAIAASGIAVARSTVSSAIRSGTAPGLKVLNRWYIKQDWLKPFRLPESAVSLGDMASTAAVFAFRQKYPERIIKHISGVYIRTDDLPLLEELAEERRRAHNPTPAPRPGFINIADIDCTSNEATVLRSRNYSDIIKKRSRIFVPEAEALAYLQEIRARK